MIEKSFFPNLKGELLSGVLNNGRLQAPVLVLLHGFASNKDHNLLVEAESFFASKKYNVFRYDVSGSGESQGDFKDSSLNNQVGDLKSAIDYLKSKYYGNKLSVLGFSLGAAVSVIKNDPRVDKYVFWSPALFPAIDMYPRYCTSEINSSLEQNGYIEKEGLKVGKKMISDLGNILLEDNLSSFDKPVLMIHGTSDPRINYQNTIRAHHFMKNSDVFLIPSANHSYKNNPAHRKELFQKTYNWLQKK